MVNNKRDVGQNIILIQSFKVNLAKENYVIG